MADQEEHSSRVPSRYVGVEQKVEVEEDVDGYAGDLGRAGPPGRALRLRSRREKVPPGQKVEVEARNGHDGVVGVLLVAHGDVGNCVPRKDETAVVAGFEGGEEGWSVLIKSGQQKRVCAEARAVHTK